MLVYSLFTSLALISASYMMEHTKTRIVCLAFAILLLIGASVDMYSDILERREEAWKSPEFKEMREQLDKLLTEQYAFMKMMGTDQYRHEYVKRWKHSVCEMKF